jgi:hypothetical protein
LLRRDSAEYGKRWLPARPDEKTLESLVAPRLGKPTDHTPEVDVGRMVSLYLCGGLWQRDADDPLKKLVRGYGEHLGVAPFFVEDDLEFPFSGESLARFPEDEWFEKLVWGEGTPHAPTPVPRENAKLETATWGSWADEVDAELAAKPTSVPQPAVSKYPVWKEAVPKLIKQKRARTAKNKLPAHEKARLEALVNEQVEQRLKELGAVKLSEKKDSKVAPPADDPWSSDDELPPPPPAIVEDHQERGRGLPANEATIPPPLNL